MRKEPVIDTRRYTADVAIHDHIIVAHHGQSFKTPTAYLACTREASAAPAASFKLASVIENTDPLPSKPTALCEFAERFLAWVDDGRLEEKTKKFYRNSWRLVKTTPVAGLRVNQITGDFAEQLKFPGSAANANCALRTLRRMLHNAEE